jgi:hypothetical protein
MWLKVGPKKCKKATDVISSIGMEVMMDLTVTVAVLFECTMEIFQFSWKIFLVTNVSSWMCQGG